MSNLSFAALFGARPSAPPVAPTRAELIQQYGSVFAALPHLTTAQKVAYAINMETPYNPMARMSKRFPGWK